MCRPELIVNNDIARTAPITHEGSHSMRASLARIPLRNNGLTAFWRKFYESRPTLNRARLCDSDLGILCKLLAGERLRTHTCNQQSARQSNSKIFLHLILHGGFDLDSMLLRLTLTVAYGRSSRLNKCRKQLERPEVLQPF